MHSAGVFYNSFSKTVSACLSGFAYYFSTSRGQEATGLYIAASVVTKSNTMRSRKRCLFLNKII